MKYEVYGHTNAGDFSTFDFVSTGRNGAIWKRVAFIMTEEEGIYNLVFGDVDDDGEINDYSVSDNGDRNMILATVAQIIREYTQKYPERWIIFAGSTQERTRLYRMAVGIHYEELSARFEIYAYVDQKVIPFVRNLKIDAFLIRRKIL